jgi:hypothetical protein
MNSLRAENEVPVVSVIVDQVFEFTDKLVDGSPSLSGTTAGQGWSTPEFAV